jgi:uncharacterized membrane protein YvbJ
MPFCSNCGKEVNEDQDVCLSCGKSLNNRIHKKAYEETGSTTGYAVLGFFVPIVGLLLYLLWKEERPRASSSAGKGAFIGFIINILFTIFIIVIFLSAGYYY